MSEPVFLPHEIYALEDRLCNALGVNKDELMQKVGFEAWQILQAHWPDCQTLAIAVGSGHNGGDGWVVARHAAQAGLSVCVVVLAEAAKDNQLLMQVQADAKEAGCRVIAFDATMPKVDLWVDAVLGIGAKGPLSESYRLWSKWLNQSQLPVLSIDVPTGLNAATGVMDQDAVRADRTVTFIGYKIGLLMSDGFDCTGHIDLCDLGAAYHYADAPACLQKWQWLDLKDQLPNRPYNAHKGLFGHVLIVAGEHLGAAILAAQAAYAMGVGKITVALPSNDLALAVLKCFPSWLVCSYEKNELPASDVVVLGPGLGFSSLSESVYQQVMALSKRTVLDADALHYVVSSRSLFKGESILTPHPKEAMHLLGYASVEEIQKDRVATLNGLLEKFDTTCVLKGAGSLIGDKCAQAPLLSMALCPYATSGMAKGGMGDVLSGVIAGLWATGLCRQSAALMGVVLHAEAGRLLAERDGERGMQVEAMMPVLASLVKEGE